MPVDYLLEEETVDLRARLKDAIVTLEIDPAQSLYIDNKNKM